MSTFLRQGFGTPFSMLLLAGLLGGYDGQAQAQGEAFGPLGPYNPCPVIIPAQSGGPVVYTRGGAGI